jgi:hypothetical protein
MNQFCKSCSPFWDISSIVEQLTFNQ